MSSSADASSAASGGGEAAASSSTIPEHALPPGWSSHVSRSTGKTYFYNHRDNIAVWKVKALAPGWGLRITDKGQYYLHLETRTTSTQAPTPGNEPNLRKRPRDSSDTGSEQRTQSSRSSTEYKQSPAGGTSQGSASLNGETRVKYPRLEEHECSIGFPESRPILKKAKFIDYSQFGDAHQLVGCLGSSSDSFFVVVASFLALQVLKHLLFRNTKYIWDVGAGLGATTEFLVDHTNKVQRSTPEEERAQVFAVDLWNKDFIVRLYEHFGCNDTAEAYRNLEGSVLDRFCSNFSSDRSTEDGYCKDFSHRITPVNYPAFHAVGKMAHLGVYPELIYVDCDLEYSRLKNLLVLIMDKVWNRNRCHIVGGGWGVSKGVRKAVTEIATEWGMRLHVEQGQCWTFSGVYIKTTKNNSDDIKNIVEAESSSIEQQTEDDVDGWIQSIGLLLRGDEDVDALRKVLKGHGKECRDGSWISHSKTWIDKGGRDKRRLTPLMHAAKHGRMDCVSLMVDEFGADVNVQAERSKYTALIIAAYEGHTEITRFLLERGADPTLANKFGETALAAAEKNQKPTAAIIREHLTSRANNG
eukprot:gb/GECG01009678.1/.p1 GENE.gb/GECG01009678.1/~~gb/GECG01009678.1/.p1  ORF type:complete len:584 (+),score=70.55 gb/GECG01009678.1/:1-1752(+)